MQLLSIVKSVVVPFPRSITSALSGCLLSAHHFTDCYSPFILTSGPESRGETVREDNRSSLGKETGRETGGHDETLALTLTQFSSVGTPQTHGHAHFYRCARETFWSL